MKRKSDDRWIVRNLLTGKDLTTLVTQTNGTYAAAWSPSGKSFVTADDRNMLTIWSATGEEIWASARIARYLGSLSLTDAGAIAFLAERGETFGYVTPDRKIVRDFGKGHAGRVERLALAGGTLVSSAADETVRVWDAATGAERAVWPRPGLRDFAVNDKSVAMLWRNLEALHDEPDHLDARDLDGKNVVALDFGKFEPGNITGGPDGSFVVGDGTRAFRVKPGAKPTLVGQIADGGGDRSWNDEMLPAGIAGVTDHRGAFLLTTPTRLFAHSCEHAHLAGEPTGQTFAVAFESKLRLYNLDGTVVAEDDVYLDVNDAGAIAPDGTVLFPLARPRNGLLVWNPKAHTVEHADLGPVDAIAVGDGIVALGFGDGRIGIWTSIAALGAKRIQPGKGISTADKCESDEQPEPTSPTTKGKPPGKVVIASKEVDESTSLTADALAAKVEAGYLAGVKRCYLQLLERDVTARGKLTVEFVVTDKGAATEAKVKGIDTELHKCVAAAVETWRFPIPVEGGKPTTVRATLELKLLTR
jgi:hypothetical protein